MEEARWVVLQGMVEFKLGAKEVTTTKMVREEAMVSREVVMEAKVASEVAIRVTHTNRTWVAMVVSHR